MEQGRRLPPPTPGDSDPKSQRRRTRERRTIGLLAAAALLVAGVSWGTPLAVRELLEWQAREQLGVGLSIEAVELAPIAGRIALEGVALGAPPGEAGASREGDAPSGETGASRDGDRSPGDVGKAPAEGAPPATTPSTTGREQRDDCWLCVERLSVDLDWSSLGADRLRLERISIVEPRLALLRFAEGGLNVDVLVPEGDEEPGASGGGREPDADGKTEGDAEGDASEEPALALAIDWLSIRDGRIDFRDLALGASRPIAVEIADVTLRRLAWGGRDSYADPTRLRVEADVAGAPVALEASGWPGSAETGRLDATLTLEGLPLDRARAYLEDADLHGLDGELDATIELRAMGDEEDRASLELALRDVEASWRRDSATSGLDLSLGGGSLEGRLAAPQLARIEPPVPPELQAEAELWLKDFEAVDSRNEGFAVSFDALELASADLLPGARTEEPEAPSRLRLDRVTLRGPAARLRLEDSGVLLPGARAQETPSGGPTESQPEGIADEQTRTRSDAAKPDRDATDASPRAWAVELEQARVIDGRLALDDRRFEPFVRADLEAIDLTLEGLEWPTSRLMRFELEAQTDRGGRLRATGDLDLPTVTAEIRIEELPLSPYNPWLTRASGFSIAAGTSSLDSEIVTADRRYHAENRLRLHGLDLRSAGADHEFERRYGVPLALALALLRDPAGDVELELDFTATREEGLAFALGPTIRAALQRSFVNALATPLKILGRVRGRQDRRIEDFEPARLAFETDSATPTAAAREELDAVADLLVDRPALGLTLEGRANDPEQAETLARQACRLLREERGLPPERIRVSSRVLEGDPQSERHVALSLHVAGEPPEATRTCPERGPRDETETAAR